MKLKDTNSTWNLQQKQNLGLKACYPELEFEVNGKRIAATVCTARCKIFALNRELKKPNVGL